MLRKKLGDTQFFQALQTYLASSEHAYDYAKTEDFISIVEMASSEDLTEFFEDWLYNEGYPSYILNWNQPTTSQVSITVGQTQSHPSVSFFEAPVPVRLIGTLGETLDLVLNHTTNGQNFLETINFEVQDVFFDPESDIISRDNSVLLGIDDLEIASKLALYPNPTSEILFIDKPSSLNISEVKIFNPLGQLITQIPFSTSLDTSLWATGLFFIQFRTKDGVITKTVLKK
jgi:hypothetical protein